MQIVIQQRQGLLTFVRMVGLSLLFVGFSAFAQAGSVSVSFQESGGDVVASFSGSVDFSDAVASFPFTDGPFAVMTPSEGSFASLTGANYGAWAFNPENAIVPFGTGSLVSATSQTGDDFGLFAAGNFPAFILPPSYTSGDAFSGTMTFSGQTFSSLGLTAGTYGWATTGASPNTVTITIPVPEPSICMMALAGLACGGYTTYRRCKRA